MMLRRGSRRVTCLHGGGLLLPPPPSSATSQTWRRIYTTVKHQHQHQHSSSFSSSPTSLWGDELVQLRDELKTRCHPTWRDCLRTGPSDPRVIKLVSCPVFEELQDREQSFEEVCEAFDKRLRYASTDKTRNPIVALAAGPGGGKSRFLEEFAVMAATDPQRLAQVCKGSYTKLHEVLAAGCIPVRITFNSYSPVSVQETQVFGLNAEQALSYRMLYSQLCGDTSLSFRYFLKYVHEMASNHAGLLGGGIGGVQRVIGNHGRHSVVLLVDELTKAAPLGPPEDLLTGIGEVLDSDKGFHALVSSLDPRVLGNATKNSNRLIEWVRLPLLSRAGAAAAFEEHKYTFKVKVENSEPREVTTAECRAARALANACNGHPRSLEHAVDVLNKYDIKQSPAEDKLLPSYGSLLDQLATKVGSTGPACTLDLMTTCDIEDVLAPALLSRYVSFGDSPHSAGGTPGRTYADYAMAGIYINDLRDIEGVPVVSPLVLRIIYSGKYQDKFKKGRLAAPIMGILETDEHVGSMDLCFSSGHPYEKFHAHWELLWRELHLRNDSRSVMSVINFYTARPGACATLPETSGFEDVHFELRDKKRGVQELPTAIENTDARTLQASMCVARNKQAGFDLVTLEAQPSKGKLLMLSVECKYSQKDKVSKNLQNIVDNKHRLWEQEMQKWAAANEELAKHTELRLVCVVYRQRPDGSLKDMKKKKNSDVLVLTRNHLERLYGPSLATLPQFIADEKRYDMTPIQIRKHKKTRASKGRLSRE